MRQDEGLVRFEEQCCRLETTYHFRIEENTHLPSMLWSLSSYAKSNIPCQLGGSKKTFFEGAVLIFSAEKLWFHNTNNWAKFQVDQIMRRILVFIQNENVKIFE